MQEKHKQGATGRRRKKSVTPDKMLTIIKQRTRMRRWPSHQLGGTWRRPSVPHPNKAKGLWCQSYVPSSTYINYNYMLRLFNSLQCKQVETSKSSCWCLVLCVLQAVYVHVVIWWMKYISLRWNQYTQQNSQCIASSQARPADKLKRCVEDNLGEIEPGHPFWESRKWNFFFLWTPYGLSCLGVQ